MSDSMKIGNASRGARLEEAQELDTDIKTGKFAFERGQKRAHENADETLAAMMGKRAKRSLGDRGCSAATGGGAGGAADGDMGGASGADAGAAAGADAGGDGQASENLDAMLGEGTPDHVSFVDNPLAAHAQDHNAGRGDGQAAGALPRPNEILPAG